MIKARLTSHTMDVVKMEVSSMKGLYSYSKNYGRCGSVQGLFICDDSNLKQVCNHTINFGEILGKHSDVDIFFEEHDFERIDIQEDIVEILEDKVGNTLSGYNPFEYNYYTCDECGEEYCYDDINLYEDGDGVYICEDCIDEEKHNQEFKPFNFVEE